MTKRILLIDDDITALDIVSFLIEERGYEVARHTDGFAAINYVTEQSPDLIIVDLMMPKINGVETVTELRGMGVNAPIIAFTAVDEPELHKEAFEAGCDRVITKPCRPEKLIEHIRQLLEQAPEDQKAPVQ